MIADEPDGDPPCDEAELLRDIELAEAQLANGEGVPHEVARDLVLSILR